MEGLAYKNDNPGAVQYGNFINYYSFHSVHDRITMLPATLIMNTGQPCYALDIGCNSGELTLALQEFLKNNLDVRPHMLGIDIDPILIERANEKCGNSNIEFSCVDFMDKKARENIFAYLKRNAIEKFNLVFCYSVTMWVHLNHGDDGLRTFLSELSRLGETIVIEPQPWKCYRKAVKRMKGSDAGFPLYKNLQIRQVEEEIERFLTYECNMEKTLVTDKSSWDRKTIIFKSK